MVAGMERLCDRGQVPSSPAVASLCVGGSEGGAPSWGDGDKRMDPSARAQSLQLPFDPTATQGSTQRTPGRSVTCMGLSTCSSDSLSRLPRVRTRLTCSLTNTRRPARHLAHRRYFRSIVHE